MLILALFACSTAKEPVMSPPPDSPAAGARRAFTCEATPELFDMPGAKVVTCERVAPLGDLLYAVNLLSEKGSYFGYSAVEDGLLVDERGPEAFGRFLRRHGLLERSDLTLVSMRMLGAALGGIPEMVSQQPEPIPNATPSLSHKPFRLVLYSQAPLPRGSGPIAYGEPRPLAYFRGILEVGADKRLAWTLARGTPESLTADPWVDFSTIPAE